MTRPCALFDGRQAVEFFFWRICAAMREGELPMKLSIHSPDTELTVALKDYVTEKVSKLDRFSDSIFDEIGRASCRERV
mgnify:CR=1 FL=1